MFRACGDQIYPGGFDGTVSQHIRQFRHIPARVIKAAGKQMAEIMWKDLRICNSGAGAEPLHLHPNLFPSVMYQQETDAASVSEAFQLSHHLIIPDFRT